MNLIVDIGNTRVKFAVFEAERLVAQRCDEAFSPAAVAELLAAWPAITQAVVASTRGCAEEVAACLRRCIDHVLEFTPDLPVPLKNAYLTPRTLGRDRLAAAVGASVLYPERNVLIVDFGTAITIDFVSADATFRGGVISPGVQMRFRALHDYTALLPLCEPTEAEALAGLTTEEALRLGVMNGVAFEIEGYICRMNAEIDDLCIIFTGGDANFFDKRIKNTIFANCNLVFCGLNRILEYNACKENPN